MHLICALIYKTCHIRTSIRMGDHLAWRSLVLIPNPNPLVGESGNRFGHRDSPVHDRVSPVHDHCISVKLTQGFSPGTPDFSLVKNNPAVFLLHKESIECSIVTLWSSFSSSCKPSLRFLTKDTGTRSLADPGMMYCLQSNSTYQPI